MCCIRCHRVASRVASPCRRRDKWAPAGTGARRFGGDPRGPPLNDLSSTEPCQFKPARPAVARDSDPSPCTWRTRASILHNCSICSPCSCVTQNAVTPCRSSSLTSFTASSASSLWMNTLFLSNFGPDLVVSLASHCRGLGIIENIQHRGFPSEGSWRRNSCRRPVSRAVQSQQVCTHSSSTFPPVGPRPRNLQMAPFVSVQVLMS